MSQLYIALGFLVSSALSAVLIGAHRLRNELRYNRLDTALETDDVLTMPITGSVTLFTLYVLLRFIPKAAFNVLLSLYLSIMSIFALARLIKAYIKPNVLTGIFCTSMGIFYFVTKNWIANNILAFALAVTALESIPISTFRSLFALLIGLFFYDIFWVFGSDVMLTVATSVDGPIKFVFPQTIFGDHTMKSLLGLGDVIVPGFFIAQTLVFSRDAVKRGNLYFYTALIAYFLSLINTMVVMLVFKHGQPALLFIVPWLLISFCSVAVWKGDWKAVLKYDAMEVFAPPPSLTADANRTDTGSADTSRDSQGLLSIVYEAVLQLFGFHCDDAEGERSQKGGDLSGQETLPRLEKLKQN